MSSDVTAGGCTICGHTLAGLGDDRWWCERCGALGSTRINGRLVCEAPKLVERCRWLEAYMARHRPNEPLGVPQQWRASGIAEAINRPEDRDDGG